MILRGCKLKQNMSNSIRGIPLWYYEAFRFKERIHGRCRIHSFRSVVELVVKSCAGPSFFRAHSSYSCYCLSVQHCFLNETSRTAPAPHPSWYNASTSEYLDPRRALSGWICITAGPSPTLALRTTDIRRSRFLVCSAAARAVFVIDGAIVSRRISSDPRRWFLRFAVFLGRIMFFVMIGMMFGVEISGLVPCRLMLSFSQDPCNTMN
jgi:hypothetical protein